MQHLFWRVFLVLLLAWPLISPVSARTVQGEVTHVTDGDTFWLRVPGQPDAVKVRIQGMDAPEICQPFGVQSRDALASLLMARQVRVDTRARDTWGRLVGRVAVGGMDAGQWMVVRGYAWTSHSRRGAGPYAGEEAQARASRQGLWQVASAQEPRQFRKRHGSCHDRHHR
jgi:micrococcal nuclease